MTNISQSFYIKDSELSYSEDSNNVFVSLTSDYLLSCYRPNRTVHSARTPVCELELANWSSVRALVNTPLRNTWRVTWFMLERRLHSLHISDEHSDFRRQANYRLRTYAHRSIRKTILPFYSSRFQFLWGLFVLLKYFEMKCANRPVWKSTKRAFEKTATKQYLVVLSVNKNSLILFCCYCVFRKLVWNRPFLRNFTMF